MILPDYKNCGTSIYRHKICFFPPHLFPLPRQRLVDLWCTHTTFQRILKLCFSYKMFSLHFFNPLVEYKPFPPLFIITYLCLPCFFTEQVWNYPSILPEKHYWVWGSGGRMPRLKSWLWLLPSEVTWRKLPLCLNFLTWKMKIRIVPISQDCRFRPCKSA